MKYTIPILFCLLWGCAAESLPADYLPGDDCLLATSTPLEPTDHDPHDGVKNIYYCNVDESELVIDGVPQLPYPDGTKVVKVSTKVGQDYPWLVAEMEKISGNWTWIEYTRNFPDEEFVQIPVGEETCIDCHRDAEGSDWVFTVYTGR